MEIEEEQEQIFDNMMGAMTKFCSKMCKIKYLG